MSEPVRDEARFVKPDGTMEIVQIPVRGIGLRKGNLPYNEYTHKDHLICRHCETPIRVTKDFAAVAGSAGPANHSHIVAKRPHDLGCKFASSAAPRTSTAPKIDYKKGYRFNIDTMKQSHLLHEGTIYDISEGGRLLAINPDMQDRETLSIDDIRDLNKFLATANPQRVRTAKFAMANQEYTMEEMIQLYDEPKRYAHLVSRLKQGKNNEWGLPCIMEIRTRNIYDAEPHRGRKLIPSDKISKIYVEGDKERQTIMPGLFIDHTAEYLIADTLRRQGTFMVMGRVRFTKKPKYQNTYFLDIQVYNIKQFIPLTPELRGRLLPSANARALSPSMLPAAE